MKQFLIRFGNHGLIVIQDKDPVMAKPLTELTVMKLKALLGSDAAIQMVEDPQLELRHL